MSIYSQMTNTRNPGRMYFMEEDEDYWQWESQRSGDGILAQYISDGSGGFRRSGLTLELDDFKSSTPDQIDIKWPIVGTTTKETVRNEKDSESSGEGGIARIDQS